MEGVGRDSRAHGVSGLLFLVDMRCRYGGHGRCVACPGVGVRGYAQRALRSRFLVRGMVSLARSITLGCTCSVHSDVLRLFVCARHGQRGKFHRAGRRMGTAGVRRCVRSEADVHATSNGDVASTSYIQV